MGSGVFHFRDFIVYLMVDSPFNGIHMRQGQDTQGRVFIFINILDCKSKLKEAHVFIKVGYPLFLTYSWKLAKSGHLSNQYYYANFILKILI